MLNFAVVGLGAVGKIHATNLLDNDAAKLSAVCDPRSDATLPFTEASDASATECMDQLLDTQPDAVIISSSTATHEEIVGKCVAANVPFLCEKPLAQNIESAEQLVAAVEEKKLITATALNRRFDPQYSAIKTAVSKGEIGACEIVCFTSRSTSPPTVEFSRTSGGLFAEKGSHFFDLARWITGEEPEEINAMGSVLIEPGYADIGEFDTAVIAMKMKSGALCRFDFSWRTAYGQDERIEVHGSEGLLTTFQPPVGRVIQPDGRSDNSKHQLQTWQERFAETYRRELDAFASILTTGQPHPVLASLKDGLMAQKIGAAAKISALKGRPIKIDS